MTKTGILRRPMPLNVAVLLIAVILSGLVAARVALPAFQWLTVFMAAGIVYAWLTAPAADGDRNPRELPASTRQRVRAAFAELGDGEPSRLLLEVVRPARSLFGAARSNATFSPALLQDCAELVEAACDTARELRRLEHLTSRDLSGMQSRDQRELQRDIESATETLGRRMLDAATALGELYVQRLESGSGSSDRLHEIAKDLHAEVAARRAATAELEALLR